jgi:hypothetical protein
MAVAVQPVIKLLNHRVRLSVGTELVTMLGVVLETSLARLFLDDGIFFHPQKQSSFGAGFWLSTGCLYFGNNPPLVQ